MMLDSLCTRSAAVTCLLIVAHLSDVASYAGAGRVQLFSCEQAPNDDFKTICRQLQSWDTQVRDQVPIGTWGKTSLTTSHNFRSHTGYIANGNYSADYDRIIYEPQVQDWSQWSEWVTDPSQTRKYAGDVKVRSRSRTVVSRIRCTNGRCGEQQVVRFKLRKQPVSNGYMGNSYYVEQATDKPEPDTAAPSGYSRPWSTNLNPPGRPSQGSARYSNPRFRVTIQRSDHQPSVTPQLPHQTYPSGRPDETNSRQHLTEVHSTQLPYSVNKSKNGFQQSYAPQNTQARAQTNKYYTSDRENTTYESKFSKGSYINSQTKSTKHQVTIERKPQTFNQDSQELEPTSKRQPYPALQDKHENQEPPKPAYHNSSQTMWKAEQIMAPEVDERSQYYEHQQSTEEADVPAQNSSRTNVYECTTLLCVCNFIGGTVKHSNCRTPDGQILQPALRKEYRQLSATERNRFHNALSKLKSTGEYSKIAGWHSNPELCGGAHSGPAFLPWHREYIKRFELALRKIDFTVSLPYWDSTLEGQLQDGKDSCLFEAELMGRFKRATNYSDQARNRKVREIGQHGRPLRERDVDAFRSSSTIEDVLAYTAPKPGCHYKPSWTSLEYSNGNVLLWLGGETFQPSVSANDPLFFMHHAFLDKLWEDWRQKHQTMADRTTAYPRDSINCSSEEHFANSPMRPFNQLRNIDGISDFYTKNLYRYQERATCPSGKDEQCGSSFLFCDRSHREPHCAAKVRYGGNCIGFENNENPCISGRCVDGICT